MKNSSVIKPPRRISRAKAWSYLASNLLVLPGLGTIMAGNRVGYFQAVLALGGFCLSLIWCFQVVTQMLAWGEVPFHDMRLVVQGLAFIGIFLSGWFWSLYSSLQILGSSVDDE